MLPFASRTFDQKENMIKNGGHFDNDLKEAMKIQK